MTAYCSNDKKGYCGIWHDSLCGSSGNDTASVVVKILSSISVSYPEITDYILWSDSCVPQNRNLIISYALAKFMSENSQIKISR